MTTLMGAYLNGAAILGAVPPLSSAEEAFRLQLSILEGLRAQVSQGGLAESMGIVSFGTLDELLKEFRRQWREVSARPERTAEERGYKLAAQAGVLERMRGADQEFRRAYLDADGQILPRYRILQHPVKWVTTPARAVREGVVQTLEDVAEGAGEAAKKVLPWYVWASIGVGGLLALTLIGGGVAWRFAGRSALPPWGRR